jgi:hypothetical protein
VAHDGFYHAPHSHMHTGVSVHVTQPTRWLPWWDWCIRVCSLSFDFSVIINNKVFDTWWGDPELPSTLSPQRQIFPPVRQSKTQDNPSTYVACNHDLNPSLQGALCYLSRRTKTLSRRTLWCNIPIRIPPTPLTVWRSQWTLKSPHPFVVVWCLHLCIGHHTNCSVWHRGVRPYW